jgi:hypothetical protein
MASLGDFIGSLEVFLLSNLKLVEFRVDDLSILVSILLYYFKNLNELLHPVSDIILKVVHYQGERRSYIKDILFLSLVVRLHVKKQPILSCEMVMALYMVHQLLNPMLAY